MHIAEIYTINNVHISLLLLDVDCITIKHQDTHKYGKPSADLGLRPLEYVAYRLQPTQSP